MLIPFSTSLRPLPSSARAPESNRRQDPENGLGRRILTVLLFLFVFLPLLSAGPARGEHFERRVLGIYSSAEGRTREFNPLREQVETAVHYLGLHLDYYDIARGLPEAEQMENYRGVLIWLESGGLPEADAYWGWLKQQLQAGRRLVLLNGIGPSQDATTGAQISLFQINEALSLMGLRVGDRYTDLPLDIELVDKKPEMVEFERKLDYELTHFHEIRSISPRNQVFLRLRMRSTGALADAVALTPGGGFISSGYMLHRDRETDRRQWRIDPFAFLSEALAVADAPRPDCTTLNGSRIYYAHIDGDGLLDESLVRPAYASSEILLEEILEKYADLPFTVSVIVSEVDPAALGSRSALALVRRIFSLPNVEPASHTYAHPLIWNTDLASGHASGQYRYDTGYARTSGKALLAGPLADYQYDPEKETVWSCRYIEEHLLPPGERCRLLLWSGNCLPDQETLALCAQAGLQNMNGGNGRFDGDYPSYAHIAPFYRQVGPYYQIHSSSCNENAYTGFWSGPYGGYANVLHTFRNTESPRRILPVNVHHHFLSGERSASLLALQRVYEWVADQGDEFFPVHASRFIDVVHGFISTRLERLDERTWRISDNGECRTVRFDDCALYPDLDRCSGVLGFRHYQGVLYVSLDESREHVVVLTDRRPQRPYLLRATADVLGLDARAGGSLRFRSEALGEATYLWANLAPETDFTIRVLGEQEEAVVAARTDAAGTLRFTVRLGGAADVSVIPASGEGNS